MSTRARILRVLSRHDSANPLESGDLIALTGGPEAETWATLEEMIREHQVVSCRVTRPAGSVVVFWPIGKIVTSRNKAIARAKSQAGAAALAKRRGSK